MMKMKKAIGYFIMALVLQGAFSSCKHEIPQPSLNNNNNNPDSIYNPDPTTTTCDSDSVYFQNTILPIFVSHFAQTGCHNTTSHEEGIILNNYNNIMNTGNIQAFNPGHGKILDVITTSDPGDIMPPSGSGSPLTSQQVNWITTWINQGALNNSCDECDTSNVTYSLTVSPIIQAKCKGCHQGTSPGGGILLTSYADAAAIAADGSLMGSVNHNAAYSAMPKGASKLPACDINKLRIWVNAGAPNN